MSNERTRISLNLNALEERLKQLGISIVSSKQDTIISIRIQGLAGKALVEGIHFADQYLQEKIKLLLKNNLESNGADGRHFVDPVFGPTKEDEWGASAICKNGQNVPSKGGTQHQIKLLQLLKNDKIRWERPVYAVDDDIDGIDANSSQATQMENQEREEDEAVDCSSDEVSFASEARLFADGVSSGDVVQGNIGNCWFLSALSVVATRRDLLEQTFWRGDDFKSKGLFVCRFMKNFVWNYVVIDDRIPVFGFGPNKPGKPFFGRCRDPNELWVVLLEKAYAKLHGSYEALIGGFVDVALNDLTGMCSEQVIMKKGHPGFGEDPFAPRKPEEKRGDPFWEKIIQYKNTGTLMGCSIQPSPTGSDKSVAAEQSAGNGLYYRHAYALVDAGEIKTVKNDTIKLVKLRNPWGMGEWTGPWSDSSDERIQNQDAIEQFFRTLKRTVGSNAQKRVYLDINHRGELTMNEISQQEVVDVNANDGTFFMSYEAWMQYYTHFFAGIDFPDEWAGRRVEGCWNELNCGGNITKNTWLNNPHFEFIVEERSRVFVSLSQEDPRGKDNLKIVPIGFHICSLCACADNPKKHEIREPSGKADPYYRLYKDKDRIDYKSGARPEVLPPAIIPGTVISRVVEDGVPQPAYTFKQSVSVDVTIEPGKYCIIPSMYMRTDKDSGKTNVGSFWISVYSNKSSFKLEGGEKIAEEEEGEENGGTTNAISKEITGGAVAPSSPPRRVSWLDSSLSKVSETSFALHDEPPPVSSSTDADRRRNSVFAKLSSTEAENLKEKRRRFETAKEDFLALAKSKGVGLREVKKEFQQSNAKTVLKRHELRRKLVALGFKNDELGDEKIALLFSGLDAKNTGVVGMDQIVGLFEKEIEEDRIVADSPEVEDDVVPEKLHQEGWLEVEIRSGKGLSVDNINDPNRIGKQQRTIQFPALEFSHAEQRVRKQIVQDLVEHSQAFNLASHSLPFLEHVGWTNAGKRRNKKISATPSQESSITSSRQPVQLLYQLLDDQYHKTIRSRSADQLAVHPNGDFQAEVPITPRTAERIAPMGSPLKASIRTRSILRTSLTASPGSFPLHKTSRMKQLEHRRYDRFKQIQKSKQDSIGDKQKMIGLPRLIGGRKSGSTIAKCYDCGTRFVVPKRSYVAISSPSTANAKSESAMGPFKTCAGSSCVNLFCQQCYLRLPDKHKLCEDCFKHERVPLESVGAQLRNVLIRKLGGFDTSHLDDLFATFDLDESGEVNSEEFTKALASLNIQPVLTTVQISSLLGQFDRNGDGKISADEFKDWILKDQVWQPSSTQRDANHESTSGPLTADHGSIDKSDTEGFVASLVNHIVDEAYSSYVFSSSSNDWVCTHHCSRHGMQVERINGKDRAKRSERGCIVFQRVMHLQLSQSADESMIGVDAVSRVFDRFDTDGNGCIEIDEFVEMLSSLGLPSSKEEAILLLHRMEKSSSDANDAVDMNEFRRYVDSFCGKTFTTKRSSQIAAKRVETLLVHKLIKLDAAIAATKDSVYWSAFCLFLHERMSRSEILENCHTIRSRLGLAIRPSELQRLCFALSFQQCSRDSSSDYAFMNSGQVLHKMVFQTPSKLLMECINTFDLQQICDSLRSFLAQKICSLETAVEHWWRKLFGIEINQHLDQVEFLNRVVQLGYTACNEPVTDQKDARFVTKLVLAMALDAIREENNVFTRCTTEPMILERATWTEVTFRLFTCLICRHTINEIELKLCQATENLVRLGEGPKCYLVTLSLVDQPVQGQQLVLRAIDPIFKHEMSFTLYEDEYTKENAWISQAQVHHETPGDQQWSMPREKAFVLKPTGLVNSTCWPHLNQAFTMLLHRFQLDFVVNKADLDTSCEKLTNSESSFPPLFLVMVETEPFIQTLRDQLNQVTLPFFWSVSNQWLGFAVDSAILAQLTQAKAINFQEVVASFLVQFAPRSVLAFLKQAVCSLHVRFEVIGKNATTTTDWTRFQHLLSGMQDYYARVEVRPQGQILLTPVHRSGSGAPTWNLQEYIELKEPEKSDMRIDRPVVYTDTLQIASIPDESGCQKIPFLPRNHLKVTTKRDRRDVTTRNSHILVVSVRKSLAEAKQPARLYCTAYDPFTSSDYAVEGYPPNWSPDFFNCENEDEIEAKWNSVVEQLRVGATLTPKLLVKVYSKQQKTDQLLGECEISIASAIAHEGFVFNEWFALRHPQDHTTQVGFINLAYRFDVKKQTTVPLCSAVKEQNMIRRATKLLESLPRSLDAFTSSSFQTIPAQPAPKSDPDSKKTKSTATSANEQVEHALHNQIADLEKQLRDSESSRKEMNEYVKQLKSQIADRSNTESDAEVTKLKRKLDFVKKEQTQEVQNYQRKMEILEAQLQDLQAQSSKKEAFVSPTRPVVPIASSGNVTNLSHATLGAGATAPDILSAIKQILVSRCPERPYNGLKKAFVAVADVPGKIAIPSFEDVLADFGLQLLSPQRATLLKVLLDPESPRLISIEEFFLKLSGDSGGEQIKSSRSTHADSTSPTKKDKEKDSRQPTSGRKSEQNAGQKPHQLPSPRSPNSPTLSQASSPSNSVVSSQSSSSAASVPAPTRPKVASWSKMKQILSLSVPEGWELRFTKNGNPYYVDHAHRTTQWKHPVEQIEAEYREWVKASGEPSAGAGSGAGASSMTQSRPEKPPKK